MRAKSISLTLLLALLPICVWIFVTHSTPIAAAPNVSSCAARVNNGVSDSSIYTTVQSAINAASNGNLIKITGYCADSVYSNGLYLIAYVTKTLTLRGGYNPGDWTMIDPAIYPTTFDALTQTNSVLVTGGASARFENLRFLNASSDGFRMQPGTVVVISNSLFMSATTGGGLWNAGGIVTVSNSIFNHNSAGIIADGPSIFISVTTINNGDGILVNPTSPDTIQIIDSTLSNNDNNGIYNLGGNTVVSNTTIANNKSVGVRSSTVSIILINSTIANNAYDGVWGNGGVAVLSNTTVVSNARYGVNSVSSAIYMRNTLLTKNSTNCAGSSNISNDYNLSSDNTACGFTQTHDLKNVAAPVGPLQNNGGNTWTAALGAGNPAINHGACDFTTDQRGQPRPDSHSGLCDIGAYEFEGVFQYVYLPLAMKKF